MNKPTIGFKTPEAEIIEALKTENTNLKEEIIHLKSELTKSENMNKTLQSRIVELESKKIPKVARLAHTPANPRRRY